MNNDVQQKGVLMSKGKFFRCKCKNKTKNNLFILLSLEKVTQINVSERLDENIFFKDFY